jgi:photosynthetic reaction center H subunit
MQDGVGPASYAMREDYPDLTLEGEPRIVPFRDSPDYFVPKQDQDPRGLTIYGVDGKAAGKVVDLWVDRSEAIIRYLEVEVTATEGESVKRLLVPMPFVKVSGGHKARVKVQAVTSEQLQAAPVPRESNTVTRREEDRIAGYFGGGTLYAYKSRSEPLI